MREDRLWENIWVVVTGKGLQAESFQQTLQNKTVGRQKIFSQLFLTNHIK